MMKPSLTTFFVLVLFLICSIAPRTPAQSDFTVDISKPEKTYHANTLFVDNDQLRVVEVNMAGQIVWQYRVWEDGKICQRKRPQQQQLTDCLLSDVELLANGNILFTIFGRGAFEVTRGKKIVWQYLNPTITHDADRLPNGNTLFAAAYAEMRSEFPYNDPQVIEVNPVGQIVWSWSAKDHYLKTDYVNAPRSRDWGDWTHVNSVFRLSDGTTLISIRNWHLIIDVDTQGKTLWSVDGSNSFMHPHSPQILSNGNILVCSSSKGVVFEVNPKTNVIVWSFPQKNWQQGGTYYFTRDAQRLPNGNTLVVDSGGALLEVTREGEIVWRLKNRFYTDKTSAPMPREWAKFFKAQRETANASR